MHDDNNNEYNTITFALKDVVVNEDVSPENTTLPLLNEFVQQVATFLKGKKHIDLSKTKSSIKKGSLALKIINNNGLLDDAFKDYYSLLKGGSVNDIDSVRAKVVQQWQTISKNSDNRSYMLLVNDDINKDAKLIISKETNFVTIGNNWVDVDLYLYGKVFDLGGKSRPNVHIELENGNTIKIQTNSNLLSNDEENRLYKKQLVRIKAKRNIESHQLKEEKLVSFVYYNPEFDEKAFNEISEKATLAWSSVSNASKWVDEIRGN